MTKFIQILDEDEDGDPVIINLKVISHISQACHKLIIYFQNDCYAVFETENADILWKLLSKQRSPAPNNKKESNETWQPRQYKL